MLRLRLEATHETAERAAEALDGHAGVVRLISTPALGRRGGVVVDADVVPAAADEVIALLDALGAHQDDWVLFRQDVVAPPRARHGPFGSHRGFAWIEVMGEAAAQSRPLASFLALTVVSGVIAAVGVITRNSVLIVGAMAVSPDLLPICATCVGIVAGRRPLARRALATLGILLAVVAATAAALAAVLDATGILPAGFHLGGGGLGSLAHTNYATVIVALAAGVAAMLVFETRASAAVGVAISVTTIPASAYLGVGLGIGQFGVGDGAIVVLGVNVAMLVVAGSATLAVQRLTAGGPRSARRARRSP